MKQTVFTIAQEFTEFFDSLPDTGELSEEDIGRFNFLQNKMDGKQKSTIEFYKQLGMNNENIDKEMKRLKALKFSNRNTMDKLEFLIDFGLKKRNIRKVDFGTCSATYRKNPPRVEIIDEAKIPDLYKKEETVIKIDKTKIKDFLKAGNELEGATLIQEEKLKIK